MHEKSYKRGNALVKASEHERQCKSVMNCVGEKADNAIKKDRNSAMCGYVDG
jgi:hypothetical protein